MYKDEIDAIEDKAERAAAAIKHGYTDYLTPLEKKVVRLRDKAARWAFYERNPEYEKVPKKTYKAAVKALDEYNALIDELIENNPKKLADETHLGTGTYINALEEYYRSTYDTISVLANHYTSVVFWLRMVAEEIMRLSLQAGKPETVDEETRDTIADCQNDALIDLFRLRVLETFLGAKGIVNDLARPERFAIAIDALLEAEKYLEEGEAPLPIYKMEDHKDAAEQIAKVLTPYYASNGYRYNDFMYHYEKALGVKYAKAR